MKYNKKITITIILTIILLVCYSCSSIKSQEDVKKYIVGKWKNTEIINFGYSTLKNTTYFIISDDGTVRYCSENDGEIYSGEWRIIEDKYLDTGKIWYGIEIINYVEGRRIIRKLQLENKNVLYLLTKSYPKYEKVK